MNSETDLRKNLNYVEQLNNAKARSPFAANVLLWHWLQSDDHRSALYADLRANEPVFKFQSRDDGRNNGNPKNSGNPNYVYLLTRREDIERALKKFSNAPYKRLGGGRFALASDNGKRDSHEQKRTYLAAALSKVAIPYADLVAKIACKHAMVAATKTEKFDMVTDVAEQAALRFVAGFFGIPDQEHVRLQLSMRVIYDAMIMQMFARHFVTDPAILVKGDMAMAGLAQLVSELIDQAANPVALASMSALYSENRVQTDNYVAQLVEKIKAVENQLAEQLTVDHDKLKCSSDPAFDAVKLLDRALNYKAVRGLFQDYTESPLEETALAAKLLNIICNIRRAKEAPDENLVPRRFEIPKGSGNYHPRPTVIDQLVMDLQDQRASNDKSNTITSAYTGADLVTNVLGTIAGLVGNITTGACIAINEFFLDSELQMRATQAAHAKPQADKADKDPLQALVTEAMRLHPPAAFIPRLASGTKRDRTFNWRGNEVTIPRGTEVVLPIGAATGDVTPVETADKFNENRRGDAHKFIFGHPSNDRKSHRCLGEKISTPLITQIVRNTLTLPHLDLCHEPDPVDFDYKGPSRLEKKWGYICERFPLRYGRDQAIVQKPLNLIMKIRSPVNEHAEKLEYLIRYGAPMIEHLLNKSKIVHFARFVLLNNETELGLFTTYDGDFDTYVGHFAKRGGALFDLIFEHIQDQPERPVANNVNSFLDFIRRYDVAPVADYFYSAYPTNRVSNGSYNNEKN